MVAGTVTHGHLCGSFLNLPNLLNLPNFPQFSATFYLKVYHFNIPRFLLLKPLNKRLTSIVPK